MNSSTIFEPGEGLISLSAQQNQTKILIKHLSPFSCRKWNFSLHMTEKSDNLIYDIASSYLQIKLPSKIQWKNLRRHRADPISSYSDFVMHIDSKSGLDARMDPPLQTPRIGLDKVTIR